MEDVVTVGLDGSAESLAAARWAAAEADRRRCTLRLLHAWVLLTPAPAGIPAEDSQNYWAERVVRDAAKELSRRHPHLPIVEDLTAQEASEALLDAAARSRLLVLGSRGLSAPASFFLGDVGMYVTARSERPVVLVRAHAEAGTADEPGVESVGVVAGVSLHGACDRLLDFSFEAAADQGLRLRLVHGRSLPVVAYAPWGVEPDVAAQVRQQAETELTELVEGWRRQYPGVRVTAEVRLESPARAVTQVGRTASLLVVGRRHKPLLAPHLGPVAHAAVHHADCPVAVVPHE
ncbi:universal stress protein [Streptomyces sp. NPDC018031]|uniref:universal stress protein n=1 Tax=Streptomyces sp. NPDC018031 TaxID=3365033 RepID=UPI0037B16594